MGTWSIKPFGNDCALDWFAKLEASQDSSLFISKTIENILYNYDGCSTKAEESMAAIAIVSSASIDPIGSIYKEAKSWISYNAYVPTTKLIVKAEKALKIVSKDSGLYELWEESDSLTTWLNDIKTTQSILKSSNEKSLPKRKPKKRGMPRLLYKLIELNKKHPNEKISTKIFEKIKKLKDVNEGCNDTDFYLPLSLVSKYGLEKEVKFLLSKKANPNQEPLLGGSPFNLACKNGYINIADILLEAGAVFFDETVMDENTGLHFIPEVYEGRAEIPKLKTYKYCPALFSVAHDGLPSTIDYLVGKGADVNQLDLNGETLIHKACYQGNTKVIEHLMNLGVDVNKVKGRINGVEDSSGDSALHYAIQNNQYSATKMLLEFGANPNIVEYFNGSEHHWKNTPLNIIEDKPDSKLYSLLRKHGGLLAEELNYT